MTGKRQRNDRLRSARLRRGWSQKEAAERAQQLAAQLPGHPELSIDDRYFSRWEAGAIPHAHHIALLCQLYDTQSPVDLGLPGRSQLPDQPSARLGRVDMTAALESSEVDEEVRRRAFLTGAAGMLGWLATDTLSPGAWQRLLRVLRHPGQIDQPALDHLEEVTVALGRMERELNSYALLGPVTGHLDALTSMLEGSVPSSRRRQLCSLAGEASALAGWLRWNVDDTAGATAYFRTGLEAAHEAGDAALGAYLIGCLACQPFYRENPEARLNQLRGRTYGFAQSDATPTTQAWLATLEANAYALAGQRDRFFEVIGRAEDLLSRPDADSGSRRPRYRMFDAAYFAEEQSAGLLRLGLPEAARVCLESALEAVAPGQPRIRLWMLVDLASAHAAAGEPESACRYASQALMGAVDMRVEPVLRTVQGFPAELEPFRDMAVVRDFREQLHAAQRTAG